MRICLVTMPWQSLDMPSLPVGLLSAVIGEERPHHEVLAFYANLEWAAYVLEQTSGEVTPDDYAEIAERGLFHGVGDWVFTSSLYPGMSWPLDNFEAYLASVAEEVSAVGPARRMRDLAPTFVEKLAREILSGEPGLVGLTSTFMQNVPSLSLAAELKRQAPAVLTVMGGGNCDGPMGAALHRNFDSLDFVVSGEGERALLELLDVVERGGDEQQFGSVPGLCWRQNGRTVANSPAAEAVPIESLPTPIFDDYFQSVDEGPVRNYVEPKIVLEAARGCWWGMRKHCTFCGLNGSNIAFRSKSPERVWIELDGYARRHQVLDVVMVDNIMDMGYITTLLPKMADSGWDLRVHYEVKSNLKAKHVRAMGEAGVVHIQPGIESLSTRVLDLMRKGVDGITNVRLLRDCESLRVTTPWNYLYGFPGETDDDYRTIIDQMPNLHHLQPPRVGSRITVERFSPYHREPELGFAFRTPASIYRHVFDLPVSELMDLVYLFDSEPAGITGDTEKILLDSVAEWQESYFGSTLVQEWHGSELVIIDRRVRLEAREHVLHEGWETAAYELLTNGLGQAGLTRGLEQRDERVPPSDVLEQWLDQLVADGLAFGDAGRYVSLATDDVPQRIPVDLWR